MMRPVATWLGQVVAWAVIIAIAAVLAVAVLVPRIAGATPYTILTGSMRPSLPPGTLVVVKPVDADEIRAGDVITYQLESGKRRVVTHRVTTVGQSLRGDTIFTTQGDANNTADAAPVMPVQVQGKLWYSAPYLGHVNDVLSDDERQVATYGVAGLLALYAAYMFISPLRDRRRGQHKSSKEVAS